MADSDNRYKFMTNIVAEARDRTRYVKFLKNFTIDAQVSFVRLVSAMGLATIVVVVTAFILTHVGPKFKYVAAPTLIAGICALVLVVIYTISSRQRSMLSSVFDLLLFLMGERTRRATADNKSIGTVGVSHSKDGVIYFDNGDVGLMYDVEGQISFSMLPAVAADTANRRHQYYVARPETTQEIMTTSVQRADVRSKLDHYRNIYMAAEESDAEYASWITHMSQLLYNYVDDNMGQNETQIFQTLILRDVGISELKKARQTFEQSALQGMYASVTPISDSGEIARRLRNITMLSNRGLGEITGENEDERVESFMSNVVRAKNSQANDIEFEDEEASDFEESQTGDVDDHEDSAPTSNVEEINDISDKAEDDDEFAKERVKENA